MFYLEDTIAICKGETLTGTLSCKPNASNPRLEQAFDTPPHRSVIRDLGPRAVSTVLGSRYPVNGGSRQGSLRLACRDLDITIEYSIDGKKCKLAKVQDYKMR